MKQECLEVLSAFMDGEAVAPESLAAALLAPGGAEALVEFARLRAEMVVDDSLPSAGFYREMPGNLTAPRLYALSAWRLLRIAAAFVVLALATVGAIDLLARSDEDPPLAARVLRFTPGVDWHEVAK